MEGFAPSWTTSSRAASVTSPSLISRRSLRVQILFVFLMKYGGEGGI